MLGQTVANYRIVAELGAGGMGIVYKAQDIRLDRFLALKFLKKERVTDELKRRFHQEARASSALNHPNIIHVYDIGEWEGTDYIAMEFVEGATLRETLRQRRLNIDEVLKYALQMADAIQAAHAAGIVHRDLKPGNVIVTPTGLLKVLDFGLAKLSHAPPAATTQEADDTQTVGTLTAGHTILGLAIGSPAYMSPEQAAGKELDARTDIFSFGSILYEMLAGQRPFHGDSSLEVMAAVMAQDPPPPSKFNPSGGAELDSLVARCLRKKPQERIQTMAEVHRELEFLRGTTESFRSLPAVAAATAGRTRLWRGAMVLGILVAAAALYLATRDRTPATATGPPHADRLTLDPGVNIDPAISPDGKFVAYASDRSGEGNLDIWLKQIGGGDPIRLTRDAANDREPAFSPDGTQIAFRSDREGGGIYIVPTLGGAERKIVDGGRRPRFSPDGNQIAYWKGMAEPYPLRPGNGDAYLFDLRTSQSRQIAGLVAAVNPVWSPDGKTVLVLGVKDPQDIIHSYDWWMVPMAGGTPVKCPVNSTYLAVPSAWTGDDIYFERGGGEAGAGIYRIRIDGKTLQPVGAAQDLAMGTVDTFTPSPARDGRMVFAAAVRKTNLYALPLDTNSGKVLGTSKPITNDLGENIVHSISADGKRAAFTARQMLSGGRPQVWGADLESGQLRALTTGGESKNAAEISPDGQSVAWRGALVTIRDIFMTPFTGATSTKLCSNCTGRVAWSPDNRFVLYAQSGTPGIHMLELATDRDITYLRGGKSALRPLPVSPDGKWLPFVELRSPADYTVRLAPFRPEAPPEHAEWPAILTAGEGYPQVRWSPDGNLFYFGSAKDGFNCLWAQRLHAGTKAPEGRPFAVQHYHSPSLRLSAPDYQYPPAVAAGKVVISLTEQSSSLWLLSSRK